MNGRSTLPRPLSFGMAENWGDERCVFWDIQLPTKAVTGISLLTYLENPDSMKTINSVFAGAGGSASHLAEGCQDARSQPPDHLEHVKAGHIPHIKVDRSHLIDPAELAAWLLKARCPLRGSLTEGRNCQCAKGTPHLSMLLVHRLAPHKK